MAAQGNGLHLHDTSSSDENEGAHITDAICSECYGIGRSNIERREVAGFREIIVRAFECEDCGHSADEVQLAGQHDAEGVRLTLQVPLGCAATLGRQVLKSDTATISVPELEFEIGAGSYVPFAGDLTTVANVLTQACKNLDMNQEERHAGDPETASKIDEFIAELRDYAAGRHAFTFVVEDHAGNSFIAGPSQDAPANTAEADPQLAVERYQRTAAQESRMGLAMPDEFLPDEPQAAAGPAVQPASAPGRLILRVEGEEEAAAFLAAYAAQPAEPAAAAPASLQLPAACAACSSAADAGFAVSVHRPVAGFVRDCVVVGTRCAACGAAAAEVRGTGGISLQGARLRLRVEEVADLGRAVLQAASASIALPDLELALSSGSDAGMATTVGELIGNLAQQLGSNPALAPGGAAAEEGAEAEQADWRSFVAELRAFAALERPWTLELTDPLDSSWVAPPQGQDAGQRDERLAVQRYERTEEEAQHFGLSQGGSAALIA